MDVPKPAHGRDLCQRPDCFPAATLLYSLLEGRQVCWGCSTWMASLCNAPSLGPEAGTVYKCTKHVMAPKTRLALSYAGACTLQTLRRKIRTSFGSERVCRALQPHPTEEGAFGVWTRSLPFSFFRISSKVWSPVVVIKARG